MSFAETMLNDLCNLSLNDGLVGSLTNSLSDFSPTTSATIINVMKNSVFGIGAGLLTLFMLIELVSLIERADGGGDSLGGIQLPAKILIKFGIYALLFCNIPIILNGIEACAVQIANSLANSDYTFGVGVSSSQVTAMADSISALGFFDKIFTYVVLLLSWLLVHIISGIVGITTFFRAFELWLLLLFSPIPLACLASRDFNQTAFNFLKNFVAVSLQGAAIIACFVIYKSLMTGFVEAYSGADISIFINSILFENIMYTFALAITIFASGRIVKQMLGVT